jgi:hypothetical protein
MKPTEYLTELNIHFSHLYTFARQLNELDFAASLGGEFRGSQDAGWATTITANQVFEEFVALSNSKQAVARMGFRHILMLYCQLAEAGGVYETLKNLMGVVTLKPYLLWPFKDLVRVRQAPKRVIGPNANATFRDLAATAKDIGLGRLSTLLEIAFRDDIRNGISHADYVIWNDGLRLRKRNGGYAELLTFDDVSEAFTRGLGFFQMLREYNSTSVRSFDPPKTIVGRFSANMPMPWTVSFDPNKGSFGISGSSPGMVRSPEYDRQCQINGRLGGKVMALYASEPTPEWEAIEAHIISRGFEPHEVMLNGGALSDLTADIDSLGLWDQRHPHEERGHGLLLTPWGFRGVSTTAGVDELLGKPLLDFKVT